MTDALAAIGQKMFKMIVSIPIIFFGMAGFLLTVVGLGCITIGKYLVMLIDD